MRHERFVADRRRDRLLVMSAIGPQPTCADVHSESVMRGKAGVTVSCEIDAKRTLTRFCGRWSQRGSIGVRDDGGGGISMGLRAGAVSGFGGDAGIL
jgi:hypothetical protein